MARRLKLALQLEMQLFVLEVFLVDLPPAIRKLLLRLLPEELELLGRIAVAAVVRSIPVIHVHVKRIKV